MKANYLNFSSLNINSSRINLWDHYNCRFPLKNFVDFFVLKFLINCFKFWKIFMPKT